MTSIESDRMSPVNRDRALAKTVSSLYGSDWLGRYVYWKIRTDPVYEAVAEVLDESRMPLLDVGCGVGILAFYLREAGFAPPITGIDLDRSKIERGRRAGGDRYDAIHFESRLVEEIEQIPGHVTLLDVVHYLEDEAQTRLLESIASRVRPGSRVILRETLADGSWRARMTWLEEVFARATGWMRTTTINFPTLQEIDSCFPRDRFERRVRPLWGRTPFNSYFLEYLCRGGE